MPENIANINIRNKFERKTATQTLKHFLKYFPPHTPLVISNTRQMINMITICQIKQRRELDFNPANKHNF